jgi:ribosomal protein L33
MGRGDPVSKNFGSLLSPRTFQARPSHSVGSTISTLKLKRFSAHLFVFCYRHAVFAKVERLKKADSATKLLQLSRNFWTTWSIKRAIGKVELKKFGFLRRDGIIFGWLKLA